MGDFFDVQLEALDKVGSSQLPGGADAYFTAKAKLSGAEATFDGELFEVVNTAVADVQDQFTLIFDDIGDELGRAAQAILEIAKRYREADGSDADTPSVPAPSPQPGPGKTSPGSATAINIDDDLAQLSDLLGQLIPQTVHWGQDVANTGAALAGPGLILGWQPISEVGNWIAGEAMVPYPMDEIRAAFAPMTEGSTEPAELLIGDINAAITALTEEFEETIGSVKDTITDWSGDTAENFKDYIAKVVDAKDLQIGALTALTAVMDVHAQIIEATHANMRTLLADSITAAELAVAGKRKEQITAIATAVGTVVSAGIGGTIGGVIGWAATGLTNVSLSATVASDEELPGAIVEAANSLVDEITERVTECKEQLNTLLEALGGGEVTGNLTQVKPDAPVIVNGEKFDPSEFGLADDQEPAGIEDKVDTSALVETETDALVEANDDKDEGPAPGEGEDVDTESVLESNDPAPGPGEWEDADTETLLESKS